jgi:hypothetical protein
MTFGEHSRKWTCPTNRPKRASARNRTVGMWIVVVALLLTMTLLFFTGCPALLRL